MSLSHKVWFVGLVVICCSSLVISLDLTVMCSETTGQCICRDSNCSVSIDDCRGKICSGQGKCAEVLDSYSCLCDTGYTGELCEEEEIDRCNETTCSGNGRCVNGIGYRECHCDPGYAGENCEVNIDDCKDVNCTGNSICVDRVGSFICTCSAVGSPDTSCSDKQLKEKRFHRHDLCACICRIITLQLNLIV